MAIRVGINGFGRIGRQAFKAIAANYAGQIDVVAINDLFSPENFSLLLKYDSTYGIFDADIEATADGLIVNGKLRSGYRHVAAELGHVVLMVDGPYCGCGKRGCLEALASRTAIERDIDAAIAAGRKSLFSELLAEKGRMTSSVLASAYTQGDALAIEIMQKVQYYLGVYVGSVVNFFDPEVIILGGGVIEAMGESYLAPIRDVARQYFIAKQDAGKIEIVSAKLGDYAGVLGAAMLGFERSKKAK